MGILGMDDLSEEDKLTVARARKVQKFLSNPSSCLRSSPLTPVSSVNFPRPSKDSANSLRELVMTIPKLLSTWWVTLRRPSNADVCSPPRQQLTERESQKPSGSDTTVGGRHKNISFAEEIQNHGHGMVAYKTIV